MPNKLGFEVHPKVALLTKHGKQDIVQPLFEKKWGTTVIHTERFDTDSIGSFDGRVERTMSPKDAALKKAYLSCEITGCQQGLGSEGSFFTSNFQNVNEELIAFVDISKNIEIIAQSIQPSPLYTITANNFEELSKYVLSFEEQRWLLHHKGELLKGLNYQQISLLDLKWPVNLEPDFRAMYCPSRQNNIKKATFDLIFRLSSFCPNCASPNFVVKRAVTGLPCELCGYATHAVRHKVLECDVCGHEQITETTNKLADPFNCSICNP